MFPKSLFLLALALEVAAARTALAGPGLFDAAVDIGAPLARGSTTLNGTTYTLKGAGTDIWDSGDQFHFAYKAVTGDFAATMRVRSRSVLPAAAGQWGRHGLMARWSTARNAKYSLVATLLPKADQPSQPFHPPLYQFRLNHLQDDSNRVNYWADDGTFPAERRSPAWMRLVRIGTTIYGYLAEDAGGRPKKWVLIGSDSDLYMPGQILVGAFLHSQAEGVLGTITFDNLSIETPAPPPVPTCELAETFTGTDYANGFGVLADNVRVVRRSGDVVPGVVNGRLRLTEYGHLNSSVAVWYELPDTEALTRNGFRAEFDAMMTAPGLPGNWSVADGMTFAVIQEGAEVLYGEGLRCTAPFSPSVVGSLCSFEVSDGTCNSPRISVSGGQIADFAGAGDAFGWIATDVTGDFDFAVEIDLRSNFSSELGWSPYGLMARASEDPFSAFTMIQTQTYSNATSQAGRSPNVGLYRTNLDGLSQRVNFLRLTRRGNVLQGWAAQERPQNPCDDSQWHAGPAHDWGAAAPLVLKVGFANCVTSCPQTQTAGFNILPCEGKSPSLLDLAGGEGGSLGYGGGKLRERTEGHPSFAVEMDNWIGGGEPGNDPPDAGSPDYPGSYHFGLNVNAEASSIHTSADRGLPAFELPDIFDPRGIHVTVDYAPSGQIDVFAGRNSPPFVAKWVLSARIPPLSGPILLGFTAGTGGASCTQEIDNFVISRLSSCGGSPGGQKPGDCNQDGGLDISDAICLLGHLFLGSPSRLPCDSGKVNDSGNVGLLDSNGDATVDLSDAVRVLGFLFGGSAPPVLGRECVTITGCPDNLQRCGTR